MQSKHRTCLHYIAIIASSASALLLWLSLDRRFLEKYYYKWTIKDWETIELPLLIATSIFAFLLARSLFRGVTATGTEPSLSFDRLGWSLLIGNLTIICAAVALIMFGREYFALNSKELGHIALAQEFLILVGLVSMIAVGCKLRNSDVEPIFGIKPAWICGLLGFALFMLLMEEISWGQHFIGWGTPDAFEKNIQNETNIHNFYTNRFEFVYYSAAFICFVVLPIAVPRIRTQMLRPLRFFIPPVSFGIAAIPVAGFMYENWGIVMFQVYFLIGVSLAFVAAGAAGGKARWAVIAVGLAMILSQIAFLVYGHKLISSYEISEMRELSISFTLAAYSIWLLAKTREITQGTVQTRATAPGRFDELPDGGSARWARFVGWG